MVKNPPASAEDMGSIDPWSGKIPHVVEQLSLYVTATEPAAAITEAHVPRICVPHQEKSPHSEKTSHPDEKQPLLSGTHSQQQRPSTVKKSGSASHQSEYHLFHIVSFYSYSPHAMGSHKSEGDFQSRKGIGVLGY